MSMYITLPCTASRAHFPSNSRGKYTTLLAHELVLKGEYEAGICEVILPIPKFTLPEDSEVAYGKVTDPVRQTFTVKQGNVSELTKTFIPTDLTGNKYFSFKVIDGKTWIVIEPDCYVEFLSGPLGPTLGFGDDKLKNAALPVIP